MSPSDKILQVSKTAVLRQCEKGQRPDKARKWLDAWIAAPPLGVRNDEYGETPLASSQKPPLASLSSHHCCHPEFISGS